MEDTVRQVEERLRTVGEMILPYRALIVAAAAAAGLAALQFRYPHKIHFYGKVNSIPQAVFSGTAHNFKGKVVGIDGVRLQIVHRPNWNPFLWRRKEALTVKLAGLQSIQDSAIPEIQRRLLNRRVSLDLLSRSDKENAAEAWVWVRFGLRKESVAHRLVRMKKAEIGVVPGEGFQLTSTLGLMHLQTLVSASSQRASWMQRLWRRVQPPKF